MRSRLEEALRGALHDRAERRVSTLRLILAAIKDRDIDARGKGNPNGISDEQILSLLQSMIKQRQESIALYEKGGREDLVAREREEITIIGGFLPQQMSDEQTQAAVGEVIEELAAGSLKDMGRVMAALKERFAGRMDFAKAGALVKTRLS